MAANGGTTSALRLRNMTRLSLLGAALSAIAAVAAGFLGVVAAAVGLAIITIGFVANTWTFTYLGRRQAASASSRTSSTTAGPGP
jgi:hypothetical protein